MTTTYNNLIAIGASILHNSGPSYLGGMVIHARFGGTLAFIRSQLEELFPLLLPVSAHAPDEQWYGGLDLGTMLQHGRPTYTHGVLKTQRPILIMGAERLSINQAARLVATLKKQSQKHRPLIIAINESCDDHQDIPAPLADYLAIHVVMQEDPLIAHRRWSTPNTSSSCQMSLPADDWYKTLATLPTRCGVYHMQIPLHMLHVARASAHLHGRTNITEEDIQLATSLVLAPRALHLPDDEEDQEPSEPENQTPSQTEQSEQQEHQTSAQNIPDDILREAIAVALPEHIIDQLPRSQILKNSSGHGTGALRRGNRHGAPKPSHAGRPRSSQRLDVPATLRRAAPWQTIRKTGKHKDSARPIIRMDDLCIKQFQEKSDRLIIFGIDASGSTAMARLAEAKGAVEQLLAQAYARRDHVALIGFRGFSSTIFLPPTRSLVQTKNRLSGLVGGGGTPLAHGLENCWKQAILAQRSGMSPIIVLITDGRANITKAGQADREQALKDAEDMAQLIRVDNISTLVIDNSRTASRGLQSLAQIMGAHYITLPQARSHQMAHAVRQMMDTNHAPIQ